ncbi:DUF2059 domain-containing protein [Denitromonas halophila]|uniref:DUF2059 domain-containing protein n=1 Tax=Denitromonas halophila TaxID=1629404 RepID=A0A557QKL5_9RHOO|nr:DUF2059 domain-containing protein [Denitromonas halophila]TVO53455.1 DUF2059 domain-containing protein [Denitromonas halophila]
MKTYILLLSLIASNLAYGQTQSANNDAEKNAVVAKIMDKLNMNRLVEQQIGALVSMVKNQAPLVVAEANIPIPQRGKATRTIVAELETIYVPLVSASKSITVAAYTAAFTLSEPKELLAFYETPLGSKLATELPRLQAEGMKKANIEGQRLTSQAFCTAFAKLKTQGINGGIPPFCK